MGQFSVPSVLGTRTGSKNWYYCYYYWLLLASSCSAEISRETKELCTSRIIEYNGFSDNSKARGWFQIFWIQRKVWWNSCDRICSFVWLPCWNSGKQRCSICRVCCQSESIVSFTDVESYITLHLQGLDYTLLQRNRLFNFYNKTDNISCNLILLTFLSLNNLKRLLNSTLFYWKSYRLYKVSFNLFHTIW